MPQWYVHIDAQIMYSQLVSSSEDLLFPRRISRPEHLDKEAAKTSSWLHKHDILRLSAPTTLLAA